MKTLVTFVVLAGCALSQTPPQIASTVDQVTLYQASVHH